MNKDVINRLALSYSTNWLVRGRDKDKTALERHIDDSTAIWADELGNEDLPEVLHKQAAENIFALAVAENKLINRKI